MSYAAQFSFVLFSARKASSIYPSQHHHFDYILIYCLKLVLIMKISQLIILIILKEVKNENMYLRDWSNIWYLFFSMFKTVLNLASRGYKIKS